MRIAILGAGAAGLTAAHLLDPHHDVVLVERAPVCGGHIRTLGRNVPAPPGVPHALDTGVIELEARFFPTVVRLLARLGVPTTTVDATTTLFLHDGRRLLPPSLLAEGGGWLGRVAHLPQLLALRHAARAFEHRTDVDLDVLYRQCFGHFLDATAWSRWAELLAMYAYSTPRREVASMPAALVVPMLHDFVHAERWFRVDGGMYTWVEAVLDGLRGEVRTGVRHARVRREVDGIVLTAESGADERFDAVVIAVPPHHVLSTLDDPSHHELRCFEAWRGRRIHTVVHHDTGPYDRRGTDLATEFDLFELDGIHGGYNARLDRLCDTGDDPRRFGLAFGMEGELDPDAIVHVQAHDVPTYTVDAFAHREAVRAHQGERGTWFAGAWLGDGLHEGAVRSAVAVGRALGGDAL